MSDTTPSRPSLPSEDQLAKLALAGLDHLLSSSVDWNGFDEGLRKGLLAMKAKGSGDPSDQSFPPLPASLEVLEKRIFSDLTFALYSARNCEFEIRVLAATRLQNELQYLAALPVPPATQRPAGMNYSDDWMQMQLAMMATMMRLTGTFPSLESPGASVYDGRTTVGLSATRNDWAKPMSPEAAFDGAASIATDFYRMLPRQYSDANAFTFQIVIGAPPGASVLMSREITIHS